MAPLTALMIYGAIVLPQGGQGAISPLLQGFWLTTHIGLTLAGFAALTLNFLGGIFYLIQERQIKAKRFGFFYRRLPSLSQLDTLNYWCLTIGFPLLTGGMHHRLPLRPAHPGALLVLGPQGNSDPARLADLRGAAARTAHRGLAGPAGGLAGHLGFLVLVGHLCGRKPVDVGLSQFRQVHPPMNLLLDRR